MDFNCVKQYGPHIGTRNCEAHYREELWVKGQLAAWVSLEQPEEARHFFWRRYIGVA